MDKKHDALVGPGTKLTTVGPVCFTDAESRCISWTATNHDTGLCLRHEVDRAVGVKR